MLTKLSVTDLDSLRAECMMAMLNAEGREHIWMYDITPRSFCVSDAVSRQNYDSIQAAADNADKPFALTGPGIEDTYFGTVMELISSLVWLCRDGYLSCYAVKPGHTYPNQNEILEENGSFPFIPFALRESEVAHG